MNFVTGENSRSIMHLDNDRKIDDLSKEKLKLEHEKKEFIGKREIFIQQQNIVTKERDDLLTQIEWYKKMLNEKNEFIERNIKNDEQKKWYEEILQRKEKLITKLMNEIEIKQSNENVYSKPTTNLHIENNQLSEKL